MCISQVCYYNIANVLKVVSLYINWNEKLGETDGDNSVKNILPNKYQIPVIKSHDQAIIIGDSHCILCLDVICVRIVSRLSHRRVSAFDLSPKVVLTRRPVSQLVSLFSITWILYTWKKLNTKTEKCCLCHWFKTKSSHFC